MRIVSLADLLREGRVALRDGSRSERNAGSLRGTQAAHGRAGEEDPHAAEREAMLRKMEAVRQRYPNGCFEVKIIRRCGPYLYFRRQDGRVRRSTYLGKVDADMVAVVKAGRRKNRA